MMSIIARRGFNYKQTLNIACCVIESGKNRVIDDVRLISSTPQRFTKKKRNGTPQQSSNFADAIETKSNLLKSDQDIVIDASLTFLREKAKIKGGLARGLIRSAIATSTILGVPLGHNSSYAEGSAFAPPRIREAINWHAIRNPISEEGKDLLDPHVMIDVGDVPVQDIRDIGVKDERLVEFVSDSVKIVLDQPTLRPLVLGGDHSISFPVVKAISEKLGGPVDILHFQGNPNSFVSPFAEIMKGGYANHLVQVGIRSITAEEREQAKKFGVELHEMKNFAKERAYLEKLKLGDGKGVKGVYVSIDVDCLDLGYPQGFSYFESGVLSLRDVLNILQNLQGDIVGGDVVQNNNTFVQYNPKRDTIDNTTAVVTAKLVRELAAKMSKS